MAQGRAGCNPRRSETGDVGDHLDAARAIDQRQVEPRLGQRTLRLGGQEFDRCILQAGDLRRAQLGRGDGMAGGAFDLDKDDAVAFAQDQVDLARASAPALRDQPGAGAQIGLRDLIFGAQPRVIGRLPRQPSRFSRSAA